MDEKEANELSKKCAELRDELLDEKFKDDKQLKKEIKKTFNKKEIEEIAVQFIMKEALQVLIEENKEKISDENKRMYVQQRQIKMVDKKLCKYCPSGDKGNVTKDGHCVCINKAFGGKCKFE